MWWIEPYMAAMRLALAVSLWFLDKDGIAPWFENNQGLLSLVTLVLTIVLFLHEQRRANIAQAAANQAEWDRKHEAEQAEIRRRADAEAMEADRRAYEAKESQRQAEAVARAEIQRQLGHMQEFCNTANGLIRRVEDAISQDIADSAKTSNLLLPSPSLRQRARVASLSLTSILPSAPMKPGLIAAVREAALRLDEISEIPISFDPAVFRKELAAAREQLVGSRQEIQEFNIALIAELAPQPQGNFEIEAPTSSPL